MHVAGGKQDITNVSVNSQYGRALRICNHTQQMAPASIRSQMQIWWKRKPLVFF